MLKRKARRIIKHAGRILTLDTTDDLSASDQCNQEVTLIDPGQGGVPLLMSVIAIFRQLSQNRPITRESMSYYQVSDRGFPIFMAAAM